MELIIAPGIVFLDEPTTGLDASTATSVMKLLKEYDNFIATIQYSIFLFFSIKFESTRPCDNCFNPSAKIFHLQIV